MRFPQNKNKEKREEKEEDEEKQGRLQQGPQEIESL